MERAELILSDGKKIIVKINSRQLKKIKGIKNLGFLKRLKLLFGGQVNDRN